MGASAIRLLNSPRMGFVFFGTTTRRPPRKRRGQWGDRQWNYYLTGGAPE